MNKWIEQYLEWGISLIPLKDKSKEPAIASWKVYQERRPTREEIEEWVTKYKNFGAICGKVSNNLLVIDIDNEELFSKLNFGNAAASTFTVRTKKGYHIYLRVTGTEEEIEKALHLPALKWEGKEELRFQGEGKYVVICGSEHPDGGYYEHFLTSPIELKDATLGDLYGARGRWGGYRGVYERGKGGRKPHEAEKGSDALELFKKKVDLPKVIIACDREQKIKLKQETSEYWRGLCPFHPDTKPSFTAYNDGHWYCYGCEQGGDVISFVQRFLSRDFAGAIKKIEEITGVQYVPEERAKKSKEPEPMTEDEILTAIDEVLKEKKEPIYHGTVNFEEDMGIFYTVPLPHLHHTGTSPLYTCVLYNPSRAFAKKSGASGACAISTEEEQQIFGIKGDFAKPQKLFETLPFFFSNNQLLQIVQCYSALLQTGEFSCKSLQNEIGRLPANRENQFFLYNNNIEYYLVACWAIGTYLFPMFTHFPYLIFVGEKGTNKSGNLTFLGRICWNPTNKLSLPTEASLFRMIHQAKPTLLIDEAHRVLNHPVLGPSLQAVLEVGHERGGYVPRVDENDRSKIHFFDVYCPKALASRVALELEEKAITIVLHKTFDVKYAIARRALDTDPELDVIQESLFNFALSKSHEIYSVYSELVPTPRLAGRYFLLWAPILAICKVAYPEKYSELLAYGEQTLMGIELKGYEAEVRLLSYLATRLEELKGGTNAVLSRDVSEDTGMKWQTVYSAFRNLGIVKNSTSTKRGTKYYLRIDRIEKLIEERGIEIEKTGICDVCGEDAVVRMYKGDQLCEGCYKEARLRESSLYRYSDTEAEE